MKNALIRANVVVNVITSVCPNPQDYQAVVEVSGTYCEPGWLWSGGLTFTKPPEAPEVTNQRTIEQQADAAITVNQQAIADANAWLAGVGAGSANLTAAQSSAVIRSMMLAHVAACQQRNGIIRLLRGKFEGTT